MSSPRPVENQPNSHKTNERYFSKVWGLIIRTCHTQSRFKNGTRHKARASGPFALHTSNARRQGDQMATTNVITSSPDHVTRRFFGSKVRKGSEAYPKNATHPPLPPVFHRLFFAFSGSPGRELLSTAHGSLSTAANRDSNHGAARIPLDSLDLAGIRTRS